MKAQVLKSGLVVTMIVKSLKVSHPEMGFRAIT